MDHSLSFSSAIGSPTLEGGGPLYLQVARKLRGAIKADRLRPGDALLSERELSELFNVSRITLRKALADLEDEGLLERQQGAGTFVSNRVKKSFSRLSSFTEDMEARGYKPTAEWIEKAKVPASVDEAVALGVPPQSPVFRFVRLRFADGEAMALETSTIPDFCLEEAKAVSSSLYKALGEKGNRPVRALQKLWAMCLSAEEAALLGVSAGEAALTIERHGYLADGRACEYTRSIYRGDRYEFVAELAGGVDE